MRRMLATAILLGLTVLYPAIAEAQILAKITLSSQRMDVFVNGAPV